MKIIDPHIHLFDLNQGDYHWLKPENPPFWTNKALINKNFNEADLCIASPNELSGFVHIEAGFNNEEPHREIQWLESTITSPFRSIAYLDITLSTQAFLNALQQLKSYKSVVGIRYILDEDAAEILNQTQVIKNLNTLAQHDLIFEAQLSLSELCASKALVHLLKSQNQASQISTSLETIESKKKPLKVIINHAGTTGTFSLQVPNKTWLESIKVLASFKHCAIKCSGWELNNREYTRANQHEIINVCLEFFGESRVMLASNFPLVLFSQNYNDYWQRLTECKQWSDEIKQKVFYQNSYNWYSFEGT